jgi:membrane-associated phospholipid phosphatase
LAAEGCSVSWLLLLLLGGSTTALAEPPGGIDGISPYSVQAGPVLASDLVVGGVMLGSMSLGARSGLQTGDWRMLGSSTGVLVTTAGLTEITKRLVGRRRPYTWEPSHAAAGVSDYCRGTAPVQPEDCKSFYSGHTAMTAAASFSAVRSMHLRGELAPGRETAVAYGSAAALTLLVASLRVAGGKHYVSDVTVGALVGAGAGVLGQWPLPR